LTDLDPATVMDNLADKMTKDLRLAYEVASNGHSLEHFKEVLQQFQEDLVAKAEAKAQTPAKKGKKGKAAVEDDEDVEMADAADEGPAAEKKSKKRKADEETPVSCVIIRNVVLHKHLTRLKAPQRSDSVKKPKIKIMSSGTPKATNGVPTPKSARSAEGKPAKSKSKKDAKASEEKKAEAEAGLKEPELTPEEQHQRKEASLRPGPPCTLANANMCVTEGSIVPPP
jgi:hypothetical protein